MFLNLFLKSFKKIKNKSKKLWRIVRNFNSFLFVYYMFQDSAIAYIIHKVFEQFTFFIVVASDTFCEVFGLEFFVFEIAFIFFCVYVVKAWYFFVYYYIFKSNFKFIECWIEILYCNLFVLFFFYNPFIFKFYAVVDTTIWWKVFYCKDIFIKFQF